MDVFDFANPAGGRPYRSLDSVSRITRRLLINTAAQFLIQSPVISFMAVLPS